MVVLEPVHTLCAGAFQIIIKARKQRPGGPETTDQERMGLPILRHASALAGCLDGTTRDSFS